MLRAILFDFDGVLADTEPIHFEMFRKVLAGVGIELTEAAYQQKYLGLDDRACFRAVFRDGKKSMTPAIEEKLVREKNRNLLEYVKGRSLLLPGVKERLMSFRGRYFLAVVSGALRNEIEYLLRGGNVLQFFQTIVSAEEVTQGKPAPEGYLKAVQLLNRDHIPESEILLPAECLVVEDSPWGIEAGHKAGMKCVAVTHSYPAARLSDADWVIDRIDQLRPEELKP